MDNTNKLHVMFVNRIPPFVASLAAVLALFPIKVTGGASPNGDSSIRAPFGNSQIVIRTSSRVAGAIDSLQWNGREFIDAWDHGRELQTAWNGNAGVEPADAETFNPTEGGSRDDDRGPKSSSQLLEIHAEKNLLETFMHGS